jgi:hypothetical protein
MVEGVVSSFEEFDAIIDQKKELQSAAYPFPTLQGMTYGLRQGECTLIAAIAAALGPHPFAGGPGKRFLSREPFLRLGSLVMRKSGEPARSEVNWQTAEDPHPRH